jgi:hypothetical protein
VRIPAPNEVAAVADTDSLRCRGTLVGRAPGSDLATIGLEHSSPIAEHLIVRDRSPDSGSPEVGHAADLVEVLADRLDRL